MLVDPKDIGLKNDLSLILALIGSGDPKPRRISKGLYEISHFNFDHCLPNAKYLLHDEGAGDFWWNTNPDLGENLNPGHRLPIYEFENYGVCDSPDQFLEHEIGKWIVSSGKRFVVSFTKVSKSDQPPQGGWRWHKWGPYIGNHEPCHEYLYYEGDSIQEIYCYSVYQCMCDNAIVEYQE